MFRVTSLVLALALLVLSPLAGRASVEVEKAGRITSQGRVTATAITPDGRHLYLLGDNGQVQVFGANGNLEETFTVGTGYQGLEVAADGSRLFLLAKDGQTVDIVTVDYTATVDTSGSPVKGPASAPVTIVEYSDFQCPYCSRLQPILKEVLEKNPTQVKLVFKNLPLVRIHKYAMDAALTAMAAGRQGKFWEMHDLLFANYNKLNEQRIEELARGLGLDMERLARDKKDPELRRLVNRDMEEAARNKVRGTPTLFVNGRRLKKRSVAGFQQAIDRELRRLQEGGGH